MKRAKKVMYQVSLLTIGVALLLVSVSLYTNKSKIKKSNPVVEHVFTKNVENHRPDVEKYAKRHGVEEHINVILAMMMQESGGRGNDPMQSSESLCGSIGCIDEPEASIEQGVTYFAKTLERSGGDVELAVQAYNFGIGFVNYVEEQGEVYSQDVAIEFSQKMYETAEDQSIYTCLREEAKQYGACYGDIYYARDVMAYKNKFTQKD